MDQSLVLFMFCVASWIPKPEIVWEPVTEGLKEHAHFSLLLPLNFCILPNLVFQSNGFQKII